jgi:hypothetical protein
VVRISCRVSVASFQRRPVTGNKTVPPWAGTIVEGQRGVSLVGLPDRSAWISIIFGTEPGCFSVL